jgi:hypothetical protein
MRLPRSMATGLLSIESLLRIYRPVAGIDRGRRIGTLENLP